MQCAGYASTLTPGEVLFFPSCLATSWREEDFPTPIYAAVDVLAHRVKKNGVVPDMVCRIAVSRDADSLRRTNFERKLKAFASPSGDGEGFLCTSGIGCLKPFVVNTSG